MFNLVFIFFQASTHGEKRFLKSSFVIFQRIAIAIEVVTQHLQLDSLQYTIKQGNFWSLTQEAANRVVQAIYILLKSKHSTHRLPTLSREIVPLGIACMSNDETQINTRDWVILSNTMKMLTFYQSLFQHYVQL